MIVPEVLLTTQWAGGAKLTRGLTLGQAGLPNVPGVTSADVLASDLRLRRRLAGQRGNASTLVSGGLAAKAARVTMPTLMGT